MVYLLNIQNEDIDSFQSLCVADAAYESDWTAADVRIKKLIVLVVQRAHSPQILTGLGFFLLSFPTYSKVTC